MSETILEISNLQKSFDLGGGNSLSVLNGIHLEMNKSDFFALMGASGSGKSTLLNIVGGLVSSSSGSVKVCGTELSKLNDNKLTDIRRNNVGWIFQNFALIENLTALENVLIPLNLAGKTGPEVDHRAKELLELVGIGDRADHFPDGLSGGQQQRVAIARALVNDPELILADEPTGNLDTKTGKEIIGLFKDLAKSGKTILMVSHDVALAHASDKVFILKNGKTHEEKEEELI
ncbi:MAG: ABC transporter ATP-binding protein [Candidatus Kariarchaeaceae archaeon]|jgi:putative ABC transport system ATP-binding protein